MNFDIQYMLKVLFTIIKYIPMTLIIATASMLFAIIIGLIMALIRNNKVPVLNKVVVVYISFFRSIPTLVELFLIYYGLPQFFPVFSKMDAMTAAIIGLSLKESSYLAEIFRAALSSVDKGQLEACLGVGISKINAYKRIILPQSAINALPGMSNTFISLLKETSLAFTLGLADLFAQGKMMAAESLKFSEAYLAVAIIFWGLIIIFSLGQQFLEKQLSRPYHV
jgi:putative amino-acid transport system permease protein